MSKDRKNDYRSTSTITGSTKNTNRGGEESSPRGVWRSILSDAKIENKYDGISNNDIPKILQKLDETRRSQPNPDRVEKYTKKEIESAIMKSGVSVSSNKQIKGNTYNNPNKQESEEIIQNKYKNIPNSGGGDCAVYAIQYALKTLGCDLGTNFDLIRQNICRATQKFLQFDLLINAQHSSEQIINCYQDIFGKENFSIFKEIISKYIERAGNNSDNHTNTTVNLVNLSDFIMATQNWQDLIPNANAIYQLCNTFDILINPVLEDHQLNVDTTPIEYYKHASRPGIWLNNSEISAYLLTLGFILNSGDPTANGTYIEYINQAGQKIYFHNNGVDINANGSSGTHWMAAILNMDNHVMEEKSFDKKLTDEILQHVTSFKEGYDLLDYDQTSSDEEILGESFNLKYEVEPYYECFIPGNKIHREMALYNGLYRKTFYEQDLDGKYNEKPFREYYSEDVEYSIFQEQEKLKKEKEDFKAVAHKIFKEKYCNDIENSHFKHRLKNTSEYKIKKKEFVDVLFNKMKIKSANKTMIFPKILKVENSNAKSYPNFALAKLSYIDKISSSNKWKVFSSFIYKDDLNVNDGDCEQIIFEACKRIINEKELFHKKLIILDIHTPLSMCEFGKNCYKAGQDFIKTYADKMCDIKIRVSYNFPYCNNPSNNDNIFQKQIQLMDYTQIKEQDIEYFLEKYSTDLIITSGGRGHFYEFIKTTNSYFPRIIYEIANEDIRDEFLENSEDKIIINKALAELYSFSEDNQINYTEVLNCFVETCYANESGDDHKGRLVYIENFRSDLCNIMIEKLKSLTKTVENKDLSFLEELLKSCVNKIYYPESFEFNEMKNELESINLLHIEPSIVALSGQCSELDSSQT